MEIPNLVGWRLDEGLLALKGLNISLNVIINEYNISVGLHKNNIATGVRRIVRQKLISEDDLELTVSVFNEIPD